MMPTAEKTVRVILHPSSSASGTAPASDMATPMLNMAVFKELIISICLGRNHCITNGPVATTIKASPTP